MSRRPDMPYNDWLVLASDGVGPTPAEPRPVAFHRELRLPPAERYPVMLCEDRMAVRRATQALNWDLDWHSNIAIDVAWWAPLGGPTPYGLLWSHVVLATSSRACIITDNAADILEIVALAELLASLHDAPVACGARQIRDRLAQYGWADNQPTDLAVLAADAGRPVRPWGGVEDVLRAARGRWTDDGGDSRMAGTPYAAGVPRYRLTEAQQTLLATRAYALVRLAYKAGASSGTRWPRWWTSQTRDGYVPDVEDNAKLLAADHKVEPMRLDGEGL